MKGLLDTGYVEIGAEIRSQSIVYVAVSKVAVVHNCSACYWYRLRNRVDRPSTLHCSFHVPSPDHAGTAMQWSPPNSTGTQRTWTVFLWSTH